MLGRGQGTGLVRLVLRRPTVDGESPMEWRVFLVTSLLIALVVGLLRGGSIRSFAQIELRYAFLILAGLVLKVLVFSAPWKAMVGSQDTVSRILYVVSMALVLGGTYLNRHIPGVKLMGLGVLLNLLVIAANGGYMPLSVEGAERLQLSPLPGTRVLNDPQTQAIVVTESTRLWFLGDIIPVPDFLPVGMVSVGDIVLCLGVFYSVQRIMLGEDQQGERGAWL